MPCKSQDPSDETLSSVKSVGFLITD